MDSAFWEWMSSWKRISFVVGSTSKMVLVSVPDWSRMKFRLPKVERVFPLGR